MNQKKDLENWRQIDNYGHLKRWKKGSGYVGRKLIEMNSIGMNLSEQRSLTDADGEWNVCLYRIRSDKELRVLMEKKGLGEKDAYCFVEELKEENP